jgi:hypothetical protein
MAMAEPITSVFDSDGLVLKILSYVTPTDADEARELASILFRVSSKFQDSFLRNLRSLPFVRGLY